MQVLAFNGSPRKKWNSGTLLGKALAGAASQGAATELIHLYDLRFTGCISCFKCKTIGGKSYGRCAVKDDLRPLLKRVEAADALILGSPIYFGTVSGEMRSFKDYTKVLVTRFDQEHKAKRRQEVFSQDCRQAFDLGARLVRQG